MRNNLSFDDARVTRIEDGSSLFEGQVDLRIPGPEEALVNASRKGSGNRDARSRKE